MKRTLGSASLSEERIISGEAASQCSLRSSAGLTGCELITAVVSPRGPLKSALLPKENGTATSSKASTLLKNAQLSVSQRTLRETEGEREKKKRQIFFFPLSSRSSLTNIH